MPGRRNAARKVLDGRGGGWPLLIAGVVLASLAVVCGPWPALEAQQAPAEDGPGPVPAALRVEVSDDGLETVTLPAFEVPGLLHRGPDPVPYGDSPDWSNTLRRQVGGLQVVDIDGDMDLDVVVGCYISNSFPPYEDWENLIYRNVGGVLEANPSWISADEVSTGDIQVGLINADLLPDVFAANGGGSLSPSVIYFGGVGGPSTSPGWSSNDSAWNNYAVLFDYDDDGDVDVFTANQGNSQNDPFRPMYGFENDAGTLETTPSWQSAETSIQNFLAFGLFDDDEWPDLAVSKWANFESGIYRNDGGSMDTTPTWTTGDTDTDKGVAWADVDANGWVDLALGRDPTLVYFNDTGVLTAGYSSSATFFGHSDLRWADVDGDEDPDLAEIHFSNGVVNIYLNQGGVLDSTPSWSYNSAGAGTAIAFGDITGNGYADLVVGNSGDPSVMVFYNQGVPDPIFTDGFESGDTNSWSDVFPAP
ncbi:MAG: VCBS repeat-containing protein [Acidobacteriota bacterium]|nr:VCBS repeat-containing protein [Acidobacteriota bacterium]